MKANGTFSSSLVKSSAARIRAGSCTVFVILLLISPGFAEHGRNLSAAVQNGAERVSPHDVGPLPAAARSQISAAIGEDQRSFHAVARPGGFLVENTTHALSAEFTATGVEVRHGGNRWRLALNAFGYGGVLRNVTDQAPTADANRVEYRRGTLVEWYLNGPLGLEQGFTLDRAPERLDGGPLTLGFMLSGNLTPSIAPGARTLTLKKDGAVALRYSGLTAWDADRRELAAWFETAGDQLRIRVDDGEARYPLTIDPYVQAAKLTTAKPCDSAGVCDDGAPNDFFGYAVSISGDASTVAIGVPYRYTNSVQTGAVYVFVKPNDFEGGWNSFYPIRYKAKLLASDGATIGRRLGWSVDVSRDGGTIVAGARSFETPKGAAYVFIRPANGWGTFPIQTQTARLTPTTSPTGASQIFFGNSVTISGDAATIAVGAPDVQVNSDLGAVYVFLRAAAGWIDANETQKIPGPAAAQYGNAIALSDDASIIAVGAPFERLSGGNSALLGAAHVLARQANPGGADSYADVARLTPSDGAALDMFGFSIGAAGDGSAIAVGAPVMDYETVPPHPGGAYVFVRPKKGWGKPAYSMTETGKLTASDGWEKNHLGQSVDFSRDGNTIVATAQDAPLLPGTVPGPGAAYLFWRPAAGWTTSTENTKARAEDADSRDWFGYATSLSGDGRVSLMGAPFQTIDANLSQGAAYVFTGSANDPIASVSPSNVTFAPQAIGTTSAAQTVTMTNIGDGPLHVSTVEATGPFISTQNCVSASPIAPGGSCSENVRFAPVSIGQFTGSVGFTDDNGDATGATQFAQLAGSGTISNTTTTITFVSSNTVFVGQSVAISFDVLGDGTASPVGGAVTVQANTGETCTAGVSSNGCSLTFSTPGNRTIRAIYDGNSSFNGSTSPPVSVNVVSFTLSVSPGSQSIATRRATYTISVASVSGSTGSLALTCSGGPPNTTCAISPSSISLSSATSTAKATVTLPNGAAAGTYTMTFTGSVGSVTRSTTATLTVP